MTQTARASYTSRLRTLILGQSAVQMHTSNAGITALQTQQSQLTVTKVGKSSKLFPELESDPTRNKGLYRCHACTLSTYRNSFSLHSKYMLSPSRQASKYAGLSSSKGSCLNNIEPLRRSHEVICFENVQELRNLQRAGDHLRRRKAIGLHCIHSVL